MFDFSSSSSNHNLTNNNNNNITINNSTVLHITLIGSPNCGKHTLAYYFVNGYFVSEMSFNTETFNKTLVHKSKEKSLMLQINVIDDLDKNMNHLIMSDIILFIYDVTDIYSIEVIPNYIKFINNLIHRKDLQCCIVGTKTDLEEKRTVGQKQVDFLKETLQNLHMPFYECSCVTGDNVNQILEEMIQKSLKSIRNSHSQSHTSSSTSSLSQKFKRLSKRMSLNLHATSHAETENNSLEMFRNQLENKRREEEEKKKQPTTLTNQNNNTNVNNNTSSDSKFSLFNWIKKRSQSLPAPVQKK
ncbi:hypothetical protein ABK040_011757 [Willaertia magna]